MRVRKTVEKSVQAFVVCALAFCLNSCQTASVEEATRVDAPRHKNWWNYYELGRVHLGKTNLEGAADDFLRCIGSVQGARLTNDEPAWRVRTYGMHFVENYFPYRELGVTYFMMGNYREAIDALRTSIDKLPSSRASYYLAQAQSKVSKLQAPTPLQIQFDLPRSYLTRGHSFELGGFVQGKGLVSDLTVAGKSQWLDNAREEVRFSEKVSLKPGKNVFEVTCRDLQGQKLSETFELVADWEVPGLYLQSVNVVNDKYQLIGYCEDNVGLSFVSLDNQIQFHHTSLGNTPRYSFEWSIDSQRESVATLKDVAGNSWDIALLQEVQTFLSRDEQGGQHVALAQDAVDVQALDRRSPNIRWGQGQYEQRSFQPTTFIDAAVQDAGGIQRLEINGESWLSENQKGLRSVKLGKFIQPEEGTNVITMVVWDLAGNRAESSYTVIKETPEYLWNKHRLRASVLPVITPARDWSADSFRLLLEYHLQNKPKPYVPRFFLTPVERRVWEELLAQQQLSLSNLADPRAQLSAPNYEDLDVLLKAQTFSDYKGYTVRCTVISASTGKELFSDDVYSESTAGDTEKMIAGLVSKVEGRFPYAQATLFSAKRGKLKIQLDKPAKIEFGHQFIVIDPLGRSMEEGRLKKWQNERVEVAVLGRKGRVCSGKLRRSDALSLLKDGDRLYTR